MTPEAFRRLALSLPECVESAHRDHPDFRVGKRITATRTVVWPALVDAWRNTAPPALLKRHEASGK